MPALPLEDRDMAHAIQATMPYSSCPSIPADCPAEMFLHPGKKSDSHCPSRPEYDRGVTAEYDSMAVDLHDHSSGVAFSVPRPDSKPISDIGAPGHDPNRRTNCGYDSIAGRRNYPEVERGRPGPLAPLREG